MTTRKIALENLSSNALRQVEIHITVNNDSRDITKPLCWLNTPNTISDGADKQANELDPKQIRILSIDELLPGATGKVLVGLSNNSVEFYVSAKSESTTGNQNSRATFELIEAGFQSRLVKYELWIVFSLFVLFIITGITALLLKNS